MEFLKVLVVLLAVLNGSLSKPVSSEDELSVIVGELERLAASLRQYVIGGSHPEYSMSDIEPLSASTSEFPVPGTRPTGPWGLDNDELDASSPTNKWLYKILKPYFRSFPSGPYTTEMPLTPRNIVTMLNSWYNNADKKILKEQTFFNGARQFLDAHFQCATTKINQIVFYVVKEQARAMTEDDLKIDTNVRKVLENWVTDTAVMDKVTQPIVMAAHRDAYGDIMKDIEYFRLNDIVGFLAKMKMLMWKAEQEKWTPVMFHEKINQLLTDNGFVFQCPSLQGLWEFHQEIVSRFQQRSSKIFPETKEWLKKVLSTYMSTEATPAFTAILQVCTDYVKSAMLHFQEVENHVTRGNAADITNFMSQLLAPHQLQYLQSIFEFLNTENISDTMGMGQLGDENTGTGSFKEQLGDEITGNRHSKGRCTEFNGKC